MEKIILASASPRRRELLSGIGLKFDVVVSDCDESSVEKCADTGIYVRELALLKAAAAAKKLEEDGMRDRIIISADTVVCKDGEILGKPADKAEAAEMLKRLSGTAHEVYTGVCVMRTSDCTAVAKSEKTEVSFKELSEEKISAYIATGEPMDKAGAYGIQGYGAVLVKGICGDYFNVVGLPLSLLSDILSEELGIDIF